MNIHKFKIGDEVLYTNFVGIIESCETYCDGSPYYMLVCKHDKKITSMADEIYCTLFVGQKFDEKPTPQTRKVAVFEETSLSPGDIVNAAETTEKNIYTHGEK